MAGNDLKSVAGIETCILIGGRLHSRHPHAVLRHRYAVPNLLERLFIELSDHGSSSPRHWPLIAAWTDDVCGSGSPGLTGPPGMMEVAT